MVANHFYKHSLNARMSETTTRRILQKPISLNSVRQVQLLFLPFKYFSDTMTTKVIKCNSASIFSHSSTGKVRNETTDTDDRFWHSQFCSFYTRAYTFILKVLKTLYIKSLTARSICHTDVTRGHDSTFWPLCGRFNCGASGFSSLDWSSCFMQA